MWIVRDFLLVIKFYILAPILHGCHPSSVLSPRLNEVVERASQQQSTTAWDRLATA